MADEGVMGKIAMTSLTRWATDAAASLPSTVIVRRSVIQIPRIARSVVVLVGASGRAGHRIAAPDFNQSASRRLSTNNKRAESVTL
jgi:hypothetical protein